MGKPKKAPYRARKAPVPGTAWRDKFYNDPQRDEAPHVAYPCKHSRCKAAFGGHHLHHGKCEATHDVWGLPFKDPERPHIGWDCNTPWCEAHAPLWTGWQEFRDWRDSVMFREGESHAHAG